MTTEFVKLYPENPDPRKIRQIVDSLRNGSIIIYPTDTVYAFACDAFNAKAVEKLSRIKGVSSGKVLFSFICSDQSEVAKYVKSIPNDLFRIMKKTLPGPYTYILEAGNKLSKLLNKKKKTVGVRIPNNNIPLDIVKELGNPLITTSLKDEDEIVEYSTNPENIFDKYENIVEIVIDGGVGGNIPSTVVDCSEGVPVVTREGLGDFYKYL